MSPRRGAAQMPDARRRRTHAGGSWRLAPLARRSRLSRLGEDAHACPRLPCPRRSHARSLAHRKRLSRVWAPLASGFGRRSTVARLASPRTRACPRSPRVPSRIPLLGHGPPVPEGERAPGAASAPAAPAAPLSSLARSSHPLLMPPSSHRRFGGPFPALREPLPLPPTSAHPAPPQPLPLPAPPSARPDGRTLALPTTRPAPSSLVPPISDPQRRFAHSPRIQRPSIT